VGLEKWSSFATSAKRKARLPALAVALIAMAGLVPAIHVFASA